MTDREPDDLYDALRDRLANYGQEPPAPLWAGIRAQLPPPVAGPQRRRKRRQAAVLLLLLLLVGVAGGQLWRTSGAGGGIRNQSTLATANKAEAAREKSTQPSPAAEAGHNKTRSVTAAPVPLGPPLPTQNASGPGQQAYPGASATNAPERSIANSPASATSDGHSLALVSTTQRNPAILQNAPGRPVASDAGHLALEPLGLGSRPGRRHQMPHRFGTAAAIAAARPILSNADKITPQARAGKMAVPASAGAGTTAALLAGAADKPIAPSAALKNTTSASKQAVRTALKAPAAATAAAAAASATARREPLAADNAPVPDALAFLNSRLLSSPPALPAPLPPTAVPEWQAPPAAARWAVQVLLGPSLTFRRLADPQDAASLVSSTASVPGYDLSRTSANVATLERPALALGGQVQLRRNLNGRWALAGGLGYRQYVSALAITLYQTSNPSYLTASPNLVASDSSRMSTIHRRDTYQYFTVPVQASYALGTGAGRWRTALQAGAELGVYVGGTTSEGTACACNTRIWYPTGSPYRALSLALSLGLDVRYRLGQPSGPWELLAQPTATYGLTSLTRAGSGFNARYPFGGGLLLGISRELR